MQNNFNEDYDLSLDSNNIKVSNDHIWFYEQIDDKSAAFLNSKLFDISLKVAQSTVTSMIEYVNPSPIWIHINSIGGDVTSTLSIFDAINQLKNSVPIITIIEGQVCSGASIISLAGTKRFIRKNAVMLIHEIRSFMYGPLTKIKESVQNSDLLQAKLLKIYEENSKLPKTILNDLLTKDIYLNAERCKRYGLVDDII